MRSAIPLVLLLALLPSTPAFAQNTCSLCQGSAATTDQPLEIEIFSDLVFSRMALTGNGQASAEIDAQTGRKSTQGGLIDLGGESVQGRGKITGTPGRAVRLTLPSSVTMTSATGGTAQLADFVTDLPAYPVLGADGTLEFSFGGRLRISGTVGGNLRGRVPITVDYN
jgi:hypothetical protein